MTVNPIKTKHLSFFTSAYKSDIDIAEVKRGEEIKSLSNIKEEVSDEGFN